MKLNYAISLSFEGVSLLQRVNGGWVSLGDVSPSSEDLDGDMAKLRESVQLSADQAFHTKIVIPNDQIRYMTIDYDGSNDIVPAIRKALQGATPYDVDDLAFTYDLQGTRIHIAAVAQDTLDEAEAFAMQHRFSPLGFVAIPEGHGYKKEPFFGLTSEGHDILSSEAAFERDAQPIHVIDAPIEAEISEPVSENAPPIVDALSSVASLEPQTDTPERQPKATDQVPADAAPEKTAAAAPLRATREAPLATPVDDAPKRRLTFGRLNPDAEAVPKQLATEPSAPVVVPPPKIAMAQAEDEGQRMTIFGARTPPDVGGKPRFLGLILTAVLLLFMAGVAAWASVFLEDGLAGLFRSNPEVRTTADALEASQDQIDTLDIEMIEGDESVAILETDVVSPEQTPQPIMSAEQAQARYAATGIWERAPDSSAVPTEATTDSLYIASIDPNILSQDAIALPKTSYLLPDASVVPVQSSDAQTPSNTAEIIDDLVTATVDGAMTAAGVLVYSGKPPALPARWPDRQALISEPEITAPDGVNIIAGQPPILPPRWPNTNGDTPVQAQPDATATKNGIAIIAGKPSVLPPRWPNNIDVGVTDTPIGQTEPTIAETGVDVIQGKPPALPAAWPDHADRVASTVPDATVEADDPFASDPALAAFRPKLRPAGIVENNERQNLGGFTKDELKRFRPKARPILAKVEEEIDQTPTKQAVRASVKPRQRPNNISQIVAQAQKAPKPKAEPKAVKVAQVRPRTVKPPSPSKTTVTKAATEKNVLNLNRINLIGVYGTSKSRRALVRLENGRYKKVKVGDRIDGGRISSISDTSLRYSKGGRTITLKMPRG